MNEETIIEDTPSPKRPTPTQKPVEKTPQQPTEKSPKNGISTGIIVGLVAVVVVLGGALGWLLSRPKTVEPPKVDTNRLLEIYNKNLNELNLSLNNMEKDKAGHIGSEYFAIHSLQKLQELEDMENRESFKELHLTPCFSNKFAEFKAHLTKADELLSVEIQAYDGIDTEGDELYQDFVNRRETIRYLIRQSKNKNSSIGIEPPKPKSK